MWTEAQQAALTDLAKQGFTAHEIGMRLGITRNAVIGRMRRTRTPLYHARGPQQRKENYRQLKQDVIAAVKNGHTTAQIADKLGISVKSARWHLHSVNLVAPRKPRQAMPNRALREARMGILRAYPAARRADEHIPLEQRKTLHELTSKTCRWPVGDPRKPGFFFCGAEPHAHWPYCNEHCARSYLVGQ